LEQRLSQTNELIGLFVSAFSSATLLPGVSEAVLAGVIAAGASPHGLAILVATVGNTLGSTVNWAIGRFLAHYRDHPRFPVPKSHFERYLDAHRDWGVWVLLLSWAPVIGDPLTIVSGVLRTPLWIFVPIVAAAKLIRYLVVLGVVSMF
jgi:membrane protein YqaA with SNARE-associated domain